MSAIGFFPWLRISSQKDFGHFGLVPFRRGALPFESKNREHQKYVDSILAPYCLKPHDSIRGGTLLQISNEIIMPEISEEIVNSAFHFSELLAFSGLAKRKFFRYGDEYCNRSNFQLVIQSFVDDSGGAAITTVHRDHSSTSYYRDESYSVIKPYHIEGMKVDFESEFLTKLVQLSKNKIYEEYFDSIVNFNLANTDNPAISQQSEIVLLVSAFERLLDKTTKQKTELVNEFRKFISPTDSIEVENCEPLQNYSDTPPGWESQSLIDIWLRDFIRIRHKFAHGNRELPFRPIWSLSNHLLFGSYIFPLLFKSKLNFENKYTFTENDKIRIDAFEKLLCFDHFQRIDDPNDLSQYPWNKVFLDMKFKDFSIF